MYYNNPVQDDSTLWIRGTEKSDLTHLSLTRNVYVRLEDFRIFTEILQAHMCRVYERRKATDEYARNHITYT